MVPNGKYNVMVNDKIIQMMELKPTASQIRQD